MIIILELEGGKKNETEFLAYSLGHKEANYLLPIHYDDSYPYLHLKYKNVFERYKEIFYNSKIVDICMEYNIDEI